MKNSYFDVNTKEGASSQAVTMEVAQTTRQQKLSSPFKCVFFALLCAVPTTLRCRSIREDIIGFEQTSGNYKICQRCLKIPP